MLGWIYYPLQLLIIPLVISLVNALIGYPMNEAVLNFVYFAVNFVCILLIGFRFLKNNAKNALKAPLRCISSAVIGLFFYWGLSYIIQIFIMIIDPTFFNVNDASIDNMIQENSTLMTVGIVLLVPIAEEFLYRGLFFSQFYNRKPIAAYLISTCIFASISAIVVSRSSRDTSIFSLVSRRTKTHLFASISFGPISTRPQPPEAPSQSPCEKGRGYSRR